MKKLVSSLAVVGALVLVATSVEAKAPTSSCTYIQDGVLKYAAGHYLQDQILTTGYDVFGYNYQAHIFNGSYANAYLGRPDYGGHRPYVNDDVAYLAQYQTINTDDLTAWLWQFRNVNLQMKWNDAWLANSDCDVTKDGVLDRHFGFTAYQGSGAWLTNHATGTYEGNTWNVVGSYEWVVLDTYHHDVVIDSQDSDGSFVGHGCYPAGSDPCTGTEEITGKVEGGNFTITTLYTGTYNPGYTVTATGTIASDGTISGSFPWAWTMTGYVAIHPTCTVSDFVKIIAPPANAIPDNGNWTVDGNVIGQAIWGDFAIIQEISSDPCGEYGEVNYMSPLKKGLGNW